MAATRTSQQTAHGSQKPKARQRTSQMQPPELADVKSHITDLLRVEGALTRGEITVKTGIPRTTVYDTLMNLLISGVVEKYVERNGRRGRPSVYYQLAS
jgi:predicted ArsR family transcriptional regulator